MSPPCTSAKEGLRRDQRLSRRADYLSCYRRGRKRSGAAVDPVFPAGRHPEARLGITASRKVGSSVVRQKVKRRIREIFRRWPGRQALAPVDLVVHLKPEAGGARFLPIREDLERLLGGLPRPRPAASPPANPPVRRSAPPAPAAPELMGSPLLRPLLFLLVFYKRTLSPWLPKACRFTPTCSEYARLALVEHGVWRGGSRPAGGFAVANPSIPEASTCREMAPFPLPRLRSREFLLKGTSSRGQSPAPHGHPALRGRSDFVDLPVPAAPPGGLEPGTRGRPRAAAAPASGARHSASRPQPRRGTRRPGHTALLPEGAAAGCAAPPARPGLSLGEGTVAATDEKTVVLENDRVRIELRNRGAQIVSARLKTHLNAKGEPLDLVRARGEDPYPLAILGEGGRSKPSTKRFSRSKKKTDGASKIAILRHQSDKGAAESPSASIRTASSRSASRPAAWAQWGLLLGPGVEDLMDSAKAAVHSVGIRRGEEDEVIEAKGTSEIQKVDLSTATWISLEDNFFFAAFVPEDGSRPPPCARSGCAPRSTRPSRVSWRPKPPKRIWSKRSW